jgi:hypothetical protein
MRHTVTQKNLWLTADLRLPLIRTRFSFTFILFLSSTLGCIIQQQLANLTTTTTAGAAASRPWPAGGPFFPIHSSG